MANLTFTISEERLREIEKAVCFEIRNNRDFDYALELLNKSVMPNKVIERVAYAEMAKQMLE